MKKFMFLGLTILLLLAGCKKDSPTEPEKEPQEEITQVIGTNGGKIAVGDIEVNVSSNTFSSSTTIKLSVNEQQSSMIGESVSESFKLEGIPSDYSRPIEIKIKTNTNVTSEAFIAVGSDDFIISKKSSEYSYRLISAQKQNEYLVCELPAPDLGLGKAGNFSSGETFDIILEAVLGKSYSSSQGHFKIDYPNNVSLQSVINLAEYLEEAYTKIQNLGFSYSARTNWPVSVTVRQLSPEDYGYSVASVLGDNYGYLEFNSTRINDAAAMRLTAGHEFFHLVQAFYDKRNRFSKAKFASPHLWVDEASAVWAEEKFTNQSGYSSPIRDGHTLAPFKGMQTGPNSDAQSYGYGMSALIKYFGEQKLITIYNWIAAKFDPQAAVSLCTYDPASYWWPDFLKKYVKGEIYDDVNPLTLTSDANTNVFDIAGDSDTLKTFQNNCPDLSGLLYNIKLRNANFENSTSIKFQLTQDANQNLYVYKYKGSSIELIEESNKEITINDLKSLKDGGWYLLAMVTNSSLIAGSKSINLQVRVKKTDAIDFSKYKYCQIGLYNPSIHTEDSNGGTYTIKPNQNIPLTKTEGKFEGNVFKSTWNIQEYPSRHGELEVTVDPVTLMATAFKVTEIINDNAAVTTKKIEGNNVQLIYYSNNPSASLSGDVKGSTACAHISSFQYDIQSLTSGYWSKSTGLTCTESPSQTSLIIVFRED